MKECTSERSFIYHYAIYEPRKLSVNIFMTMKTSSSIKENEHIYSFEDIEQLSGIFCVFFFEENGGI